jgi:hypothetical protein
MLRALCLVCLLTASLMPPPAAASGSISGDGQRLLDAKGVPAFVTALNYEGPADRAWQMWQNDRFDANLIEADFARAVSAGAKALRVFVQAPLAQDIAADNWNKLDIVVGLAEKRELQLILSLHDYAERDLAKVSATAEKIAARYRGRAGILAYDIKNEPRFNDLSLSRYPSPPPLQQRGLIDTYGERLSRGELGEFRASDDGRKDIPAAISDEEAWPYINNLRLYRDMLAEASAWVRERGFRGTTLDYLNDSAGKKWAPLQAALDSTLKAWLSPQVEAIRRGDPSRAITLHHVDAVLASLPANASLDYHSLHRYPSTGAASIRATLSLLKTLQNVHGGRPYVLGEFGHPTETLDPDKSSIHEIAVFLGLLSQNAAGGAKWMLNDMPEGFNMRERTLGAFRLDGGAKPIASAMAALRRYLSTSGSSPGDLRLEDDGEVGLRYVYRASDALMLGGKRVEGGSGAVLEANGPAQVFISWGEPNLLRIWASAPTKLTLDLKQLLGRDPPSELTVTPQHGSVTRSGASLKLSLSQPGDYILRVGAPPMRGDDYPIQNGHFFTQTNGRKESMAGFSVTNKDGVPLWDAFQEMGGVDVLGYPVTRRFELDGFIVQGFQKAVLQWRPDEGGEFWFLNTFDVLHDRGRDDWLEIYRQTPRPFDNAPDAGLSWERVVARHVALLDKVPPPLKDRFLSNPKWLDHFGLPVATQEYPNSVVVRAQRAAFQYWKESVPWAAKGTVTVANGGDLAKEAGVFPWLAVTPENAPP